MTIDVTIDPGGVKKGFIIQRAREFCGTAGYDFGELTPEELASHLNELDMMMAESPWDTLGYNFTTYGAGLPEDASGLPNSAISAVSKYLGLRIAPGLGKNLSPAANAALTRSYNLLFAQTATIPTMPRPRTTPRGAGNQWWQPWSPYIIDQTDDDDDNPVVTLE